MQATVLSIAGSDPTGGAGIQADLKTMTSIGVYGAAVVTCVTVQNSHGVVRIECLPADLVYEQIKIVMDDHLVTHVKVGMIGNHEIGQAIVAALSGFKGEIIYDPVMLSSTGHALGEGPPSAAYATALANECTVLTPNIPELELLARKPVQSIQDAQHHTKLLFEKYRKLQAVLVKGGHYIRDNGITDTLAYSTKDGPRFEKMTHQAIKTMNIHGTGCTFASAFAAFHCLKGNYITAFQQSVEYMQSVLKDSKNAEITKNREGQGCMLHYAYRHSPDSKSGRPV